jgi:hypothetical protein
MQKITLGHYCHLKGMEGNPGQTVNVPPKYRTLAESWVRKGVGTDPAKPKKKGTSADKPDADTPDDDDEDLDDGFDDETGAATDDATTTDETSAGDGDTGLTKAKATGGRQRKKVTKRKA